MNSNPYEPPSSQVMQQSPSNEARLAARHRVRIALLVLLVPAIYNLICFSFLQPVDGIELSIYQVYRTMNVIGLIAVILAVWFFGLAVLELATGLIHAIAARRSRLDDWKIALYGALRLAPLFAILGALLWIVWVAAFYQLRFDFFTVSVPIGAAAHVLAACLYVPLVYRWYKLERRS